MEQLTQGLPLILPAIVLTGTPRKPLRGKDICPVEYVHLIAKNTSTAVEKPA